MKTDLLSPILDVPSPDINFFEGRLLTARDMREQHQADRARSIHLGQAIGSGVVKGLEVSLAASDADTGSPILDVKAGLALNGLGNMLELSSNHSINLIRSFESLPQNAGTFKQCVLPDTEYDLFGTGVYILFMLPATGYKEYAPKTGLDSDGKTSDCGRRYQVEGVQFRLEKLEAVNIKGVSPETLNSFNQLLTNTTIQDSCRFQNLLAHLGFGTENRLEQFTPNLLQAEDQAYGILDNLIALDRYSKEDVPLALLHWSTQGIQFVDQWSVRRTPYTTASDADWADLMQPRYQSEAEAMLFQFQDTIKRILKKIPNVSSLSAFGLLDYLPPAGFLPTANGQFNWKTFLGKHAPENTIKLAQGLFHSRLYKARMGAGVPVLDTDEAIPYTVYEITGETGYVFLARSHYAEVIARDVYFDASACDMLTGNSVQDAIQQLCANSTGTCSITVSPTTDFTRLLASLVADQDIHICFQPGTYQLKNKLVFQNLKHVHLSGAGLATRLQSRTTDESAIEFKNCESVQVNDFLIRTGSAGTESRLKGAITGVNCPKVRTYRIAINMASTAYRSASCLNFRMTAENSSSSVNIKDCECLAGNQQVGILLLNYGRTYVANNKISLAKARTISSPASSSILVTEAKRKAKDIELFMSENKEVLSRELLRLFVGFTRVNKSTIAVDASNPVRGIPILANVAESERAILQGIVIGGRSSQEVQVLNNQIDSAIQGIHVGLSHHETSKGDPDLLAHVTISGNSIDNILPPTSSYKGERHAIFVGNCKSVLLCNNVAKLERLNNATQRTGGIRLFGYFGRRIIVKDNDIQSYSIGIRLMILNVSTSPEKVWVITDNLLEGSSIGSGIDINSQARPLVRNERNLI